MSRTLFVVAVAVLLAPPAWAAARQAKGGAKGKAELAKQEERMVTAKGTTRIDLEGSNVNGQPNRSGSVYLLQREDLPAKSMVRQRSSFRDQIVRDVLSQ
ncbi:MAG: hypothetical protein QM765_15470 [Myxococcales bacterium]